MSSKYRVIESAVPHFVTYTIVGWADVFTREIYKELFLDSLRYCIEHKGLIVHAWVIMTNHVHMIISSTDNKIEFITRDIKKFTSKKIVEAIKNNNEESRKEWLLNLFNYAGKTNHNNKEIQFWRQYYHPIELDTDKKLSQRLAYLHMNPVRSGLVWEPWHYKFSSAINYYCNAEGLIPISLL